MIDEDHAYHVEELDGSFAVFDADGTKVMDCGAELNATHYLTLLNQVYKRGYKAGYRAGKAAASG